MAKKYFDNHKLQIAYDYYFSNIECDTWENIHSVLNITSGDNLPKRKMIEGKYQVYGGGGITNNSHNKFNIDYETIGIGRVGARCGCVFNIKKNSWVTDNALLVQSFDDRLSLNFLKHYLNYQNLGQFANNAMQPVISKTRISSIKIPVIDLVEQNKIAKNLDILENNTEDYKDLDNDLLSKISVVDKWKELTIEIQTQKQLLNDLKQATLQEAIQGKLTKEWREQNPNAEPASVLLERIKTEKKELEKDLKVRKEKPLPQITEEEYPFAIPKNWIWCILDDITLFKNGKAHEQFVDADGKYVLINSKFVSTNGEKVKYTGNLMMPMFVDEIAIVMSDVPNGRALSRCFIIDENDKYSLNQRIGGIVPISGIYPKYLLYLLDRNKHYLSFNDGKKQTNLKKSQIMSCPIPLPPFEEQKAIVEKVETLMQKCNELEQEITQSEQHANMLMQAVLKEAFESKTENTEEYANA